MEQQQHQPDRLVMMTVDQIMREQGVGKKRAFMIRRRLSEEAHDEPVPNNQRERVIDFLQRKKVRTSNDLTRELQGEGYAIDDHDATKVLWSLQKTGHVKFRERPHGLLYAIRLTEAGADYETTSSVMPKAYVEEDSVGTEENDVAVDEGFELIPDIHVITRPWIKGNLGGWPAIRELRDRARKNTKLTQAAKLLEEVGEDDIALDLMTKTSFTSLEEEVISLLEAFEELP